VANIEENAKIAGIDFRSDFSSIDLESIIITRILQSFKNSEMTLIASLNNQL